MRWIGRLVIDAAQSQNEMAAATSSALQPPAFFAPDAASNYKGGAAHRRTHCTSCNHFSATTIPLL